MIKNQLVDTLKGLGLTEHESQIYFATLSLGPSTILKIARAAEVKRTTAYSVVDSLKQKGLIDIQVEGFKKIFVAEDPVRLKEILETRNQRLQDFLPEFSALYNLKGGESFIKYYEGLSAIKGVYESLIRDVKPHEDYLVMGNQDYWINHDKEYFMDFLYRRAKLPIKIRMMFQDSPLAHEWKGMEKNFNSKVSILPKGTQLNTNLVITPQRVFIHQLTAPLIGIVIENKSVIKMHREMYEIMWNAINKN